MKIYLVLQGEVSVNAAGERVVVRLAVIDRCMQREHAQYVVDGLRTRYAENRYVGHSGTAVVVDGTEYAFEIAEMDTMTGDVR